MARPIFTSAGSFTCEPLRSGAQGGFLDNYVGNIGSFAGDVNGDGFGDFAIYAVHRRYGERGRHVNDLILQAGEFAFETAGDLDGDGYSDVIFWIGSFTGIPEHERAYFGGPGSSSTSFSTITIPGHGNSPGSQTAFIAAVGDVNGDGIDDLVATTPDSGMVYVFKSDGAPGRQSPSPIRTSAAESGLGAASRRCWGQCCRSPSDQAAENR